MTGLRSISTTTSSPGIDVELSRSLAKIRADMREGGHQAELEPAVVTRLQHRQAVLQSFSTSATADQIKLEIAKLTTAFPSLRGTGAADAQAMVAQYATALQDVPLWAIREVCSEIVRGAVPGLNPDFPPTAPRIRKLVDDRTGRFDLEARQIHEILSAPVAGPDNPEMAEKTQKLIGASMRGLADAMREKDRQFAGVAAPEKPPFTPLSIEECADLYKTRPLPGMPARNVTRNDDRNVTVDKIDDAADLAEYERRVAQ